MYTGSNINSFGHYQSFDFRIYLILIQVINYLLSKIYLTFLKSRI